MVERIIKSNMPADNACGQNGFQGPSSAKAGSKKPPHGDWQTRAVDENPIAPAHGHRNRSVADPVAKVPSTTIRR
jgi:hypothetical protein